MMTLKKLVMWLSGLMGNIQICYLAMAGRIIMAAIFWKSAMTKIAFNEAGLGEFSLAQIWNVVTLDWTVASGTYTLFEYDYDLPLLPPELAAHMALAAEILLPMALILGLFTRYAALAMLAMTAVIQIFVYPNLWTVHGLWAIALLVIMAKGGGKLSLDRLICKKCL
tara:strand:+ start:516 stop:1016 length:501 start_codon:yes stop_codon:yes gene_type:complete